MSAVQEKWDRIYASRSIDGDGHPALLDEVAHLLPTEGRALDLACGTGSASIFLARRGLDVLAWDISPVVVRKLGEFASRARLSITPQVVDITAAAIPQDSFDVVFVSRFLERGVCDALARSLRPGGLLAYQTFSIESVPGAQRMNPAYCVVRGEMLDLFRGLQTVLYHEEALVGDCRRGLRNEVRLLAERPRPAPAFMLDWIRCVTEGHERRLTAAVARWRSRLAALPDPWASLLERGRSEEWLTGEAVESDDCMVLPDKSLPRWRAMVLPKQPAVIPTDLSQAEAARLGRVVDEVCNALRAEIGAVHCRSWVPVPVECTSRRMRVLVDPDVGGQYALKAAWPAVAERVRRSITP